MIFDEKYYYNIITFERTIGEGENEKFLDELFDLFDLFDLFNGESNPLGEAKYQEIICEKKIH